MIKCGPPRSTETQFSQHRMKLSVVCRRHFTVAFAECERRSETDDVASACLHHHPSAGQNHLGFLSAPLHPHKRHRLASGMQRPHEARHGMITPVNACPQINPDKIRLRLTAPLHRRLNLTAATAHINFADRGQISGERRPVLNPIPVRSRGRKAGYCR